MKKYFFLLIIIGFVFRLLLFDVAHHGDLNNNISWGKELWNRGIVDYYGSSYSEDWPYSAPNQPPLYILTYATTSYLYDSIDSSIRSVNDKVRIFPSNLVWFWESSGMRLCVKLPSILADVGIAWLIYKYFQKKDAKKALILCALWLFNPISWYNSSVWGQNDAIVNFFGMLAIFALLSKRLAKTSLWYSMSFVFKGSILVFGPILGIFAFRQTYGVRKWLKAILVFVLVVTITSVWFMPSAYFPVWLVDLYQNRILPGEIGYLTANAFNFWWLIDSGKTLDSTVYLGLSARVWGLLFMSTVYLYVGIRTWKGKLNDKNLFLSLVLISLATFLFMTRVHERYLYPVFPIATLGLFYFRWLIIPYVVLSVVYLLNMYHLFFAPSILMVEKLFTQNYFTHLLVAVNLIVFVYFLYKYHSNYEPG
ncbi:hypothetical protein ACFL2C_00835 [Patescibacteria group bacterium]